MWELRITHQIADVATDGDPNEAVRFDTTAELWLVLATFGVPKRAWWCGENKRHEYFGGRLVWERLAHRVPNEYGEFWA